jgi:hypothetical protein
MKVIASQPRVKQAMRYSHDSDQIFRDARCAMRDARCAPAAMHRRFLAGTRQITAASTPAATDSCFQGIDTL